MKSLYLATAAAAVMHAGAAQAAPQPTTGDAVTCSGSFICSSSNAVIGSGTEFTFTQGGGSGTFSADFSPGLIRITFNNSVAYGFGGQTQLFGDLTNPITSASIVSQSGITQPFLDGYNISAVGNSLRVFFGGTVGLGITVFQPGATVSIALNAAPPVPEPTTWAMMVGGFGIAGAAMRRRRRERITVCYA